VPLHCESFLFFRCILTFLTFFQLVATGLQRAMMPPSHLPLTMLQGPQTRQRSGVESARAALSLLGGPWNSLITFIQKCLPVVLSHSISCLLASAIVNIHF
jgi:hypothetical protein